MDFTRGPVRLAVAGAVLGVAVVGGAFGAMALSDDGSSTPDPTVHAAQVADTDATTSTVATTVPGTVAPVTTPAATTPAPQFENYTPGGELPAAPPAPTPENPTVSTVMGPAGPLYPDGYTQDTSPPPPAPTVAPRPAPEN